MLLLMSLACDSSPPPAYGGTKMSDYFAFDGSRKATFNNDDTSITWQLVVEKKAQTTVVDGREIVTMEYSNNETAEVLGSVQWSTVTGDATWVHGYSLGAMGETITFDPPIAITDDDDAMRMGDVLETDTTDSNGVAQHYTSTFTGPETPCGVTANADFDHCVVFNITDGVDDPATSPLFVGTFTLVAAYNMEKISLPAYTQQWELTQIAYTSSEDGG